MDKLIDAVLTAMAEERRRYTILWDCENGTFSVFCAVGLRDEPPLFEPEWGSKEDTRAACEAHLERLVLTAALDRIGAVVVPRQPTEAMLDNGDNADEVVGDWTASSRENVGIIYRAMIAAGETP